jgi:sugar phosphate isomerase/epimerase
MAYFGYHAVYEKHFASAIKAASDYGFQYVQFDLNVPDFYIDRLSRRQLNDIKSLAADLGIEISFHAPGDYVSLFTDYPPIRKGILDHFERILQQANHLNAHHLTVHPLNPPSFRRADTLEDAFQNEQQEYFKRVLKENLIQLTKSAGDVLVSVENCHIGSIANTALCELFSEGIDIYLTLDWAKMHTKELALDKDQFAFFTDNKHRIRELHLHDADGKGKTHLAPEQGILEFDTLFENFYNQDQWLTIEVRPVLEAAKAKIEFEKMIRKQEQ